MFLHTYYLDSITDSIRLDSKPGRFDLIRFVNFGLVPITSLVFAVDRGRAACEMREDPAAAEYDEVVADLGRELSSSSSLSLFLLLLLRSGGGLRDEKDAAFNQSSSCIS